MLHVKSFLSIILLLLFVYNTPIYSDTKATKAIQYKPHAPVEMMFNIDTTENKVIKVNQDVSLQVTFKNNIDVDDLIVHFHTNENLILVSEHQHYFGLQPSFQKNKIDLMVIPKSEGILYINISATLVSNGIQQSRSFAIPVNVGYFSGNNAFKANINLNELKAVGGIISMPAIKR